MRAGASLFAAAVVLAVAAGCAGPRTLRESDMANPGALVGNTVQVPVGEGRTETITVTRIEGTTLVGHRPWDPVSAVRGPDEVRIALPKDLARSLPQVPSSEKPRALEERNPSARAPSAPPASLTSRTVPASLAGPTRGKNRLAVLDFRGALAPESLEALSEEARGAAAEAGRRHGVSVMTRESIAVVLKDMTGSSTCKEGECEVETARNIGADLVITGSVLKVEGTYLVNVKLHESAGGSLLRSKQVRGTATLELLDGVRTAVGTLFE